MIPNSVSSAISVRNKSPVAMCGMFNSAASRAGLGSLATSRRAQQHESHLRLPRGFRGAHFDVNLTQAAHDPAIYCLSSRPRPICRTKPSYCRIFNCWSRFCMISIATPMTIKILVPPTRLTELGGKRKNDGAHHCKQRDRRQEKTASAR